MATHEFNWKIGGPAGFGIKSVGAMFSLAVLRHGMYVYCYDEYPSLIRGGHNSFEVHVSTEKIYSVRRPVHVLVALDQVTLDAHLHELAPDAGIIYNEGSVQLPGSGIGPEVKLFAVPLDDIVVKLGGEKVMRNVVALGASFALIGMPFEALLEQIQQTLKKKDGAVVESNTKLARAGFDYIREHFKEPFAYQVQKMQNPGRMLMVGNEAIAWGAIKAGLKLYSGYPMTPSTSILHAIAAQARNYHIVFRQTEDEISAITTVIGAGYAGVRAMTATSGGGFSLMTEAVGMAAMMEVPIVIVEAMRPGPSTGMPTWTGQGDLRFVLHASQDEFPRFVMAPGSIEQCFELIQRAFDIAEKYQTPVILITDKLLAEAVSWVDALDLKPRKLERGAVLTEQQLTNMKEYKRYLADVANGVSPRTLPGTKGGEHIANSDEHTEDGFSEEGSEERVRMMDKRGRKIEAARKEIPAPRLEGDRNADITFVSWGSTRGAILEAMKDLKQEKVSSNFLQVQYLSPFPAEAVRDVIKKAKKVAIVECSKEGQFAGLVREHTGLAPDYKILKYDGRPFFPNEIVEAVKDLL